MRIIAGTYGGRTICAPKGSGTRPTTDRMRESLMSSLGSYVGDLSGLSILDAFAGSGAFGFECLSRGAKDAVFCDKDPNALRCIRSNAKTLGLDSAKVRVERRDVMRQGFPAAFSPYDLVYLDPPYAYDSSEVLALVGKALEKGILKGGAFLAYERAADSPSIESQLYPLHAELLSQKRSSICTMDIIRISS